MFTRCPRSSEHFTVNFISWGKEKAFLIRLVKIKAYEKKDSGKHVGDVSHSHFFQRKEDSNWSMMWVHFCFWCLSEWCWGICTKTMNRHCLRWRWSLCSHSTFFLLKVKQPEKRRHRSVIQLHAIISKYPDLLQWVFLYLWDWQLKKTQVKNFSEDAASQQLSSFIHNLLVGGVLMLITVASDAETLGTFEQEQPLNFHRNMTLLTALLKEAGIAAGRRCASDLHEKSLGNFYLFFFRSFCYLEFDVFFFF